MNVAVFLLSCLVVALVVLILTKRYRFPLMVDVGMGMIAMGLVGAIDSLITDTTCTSTALAVRWGLIGGGLFLMLVSVSIRAGDMRGSRSSDIIPLSEDDMAKVRGRGRH